MVSDTEKLSVLLLLGETRFYNNTPMKAIKSVKMKMMVVEDLKLDINI